MLLLATCFTGIVMPLLTWAAPSASYSRPSHDHNAYLYKRQPHSTLLMPPSRPLEWGDVNIIHTTDIHGWLLGHQEPSFPEPNYSGNFGEFASFVAHMNQSAIDRDVDLLLVDTGDLHDGTGLSDGYPAGGIGGHDTDEFVKMLPYDALTIGNHELNNYTVTLDVYQNFVPHFKDRYLASNANITVMDKAGKSVNGPIGHRFAKFRTRKGLQVTALGIIFNIKLEDERLTAQKVEDMVEETWFKKAIEDKPDFFLLLGHMPIVNDTNSSDDKWPHVFHAIRTVHPYTPILIFGGHSHIRNCNQLGGRSMSLQSGRYMETVGWMSVKLDGRDGQGNLTFTRRYLDANRIAYQYHTNRSDGTFDTTQGKAITEGLHNLYAKFKLDTTYGTVPQDFTLTRSRYPSSNSVLSELVNKVLPYALAVNNSRTSTPNITIITSGSIRFDILSGSFNRNDLLTASPFTNHFRFIPNVTLSAAEQVVPTLNKKTLGGRLDGSGDLHARDVYNTWIVPMDERNTLEDRDNLELTPGYVTKDECPGKGDDIPHTNVSFFKAVSYIASPTPSLPDNATIDLVFTDRLQKRVIEALNKVQKIKVYTSSHTRPYTNITSNEAWAVYAKAKWNGIV